MRGRGARAARPAERKEARAITTDPHRLAALCRLWQQEGRTVEITLQGDSMRPTILPGSRLTLQCRRWERGDELPVGAVVAFRREGHLVVHRLQAVAAQETAEARVICQGDNNASPDAPVGLEDLVGLVSVLRRPARWVTARQWLAQVTRPVRHRLRG